MDTQEVPVKPWYTSHGTWAAILVGLLPIINHFTQSGFTNEDVKAWADMAALSGQVVAAAYVVYRRFTAPAAITLTKGKSNVSI